MTALPASVLVRDVSLRDGLQDEEPISTEAKIAIAEALVAAGVRELELTSFVRPDRVPAMADAEALSAATQHLDVVRWGLVLNRRGAERALAAGIDHLQYVVSVSDTHSRHNAGASTDDALAEFAAFASGLDGAVIEMTLSTSFGCPYEGPIDPAAVVEAARRSADGRRVLDRPRRHDRCRACRRRWRRWSTRSSRRSTFRSVPTCTTPAGWRSPTGSSPSSTARCGSTRASAGSADARSLPAPAATCRSRTSSTRSTAMGVDTGCSVDGLIEAARLACDAVGRPVGSHVGIAGPRFATPVPSPG